MIDIGLDFGSTYSVASYYDREKETVETVKLAENDSPSVPSVVAVNKYGTVTIGKAAKGKGKNATVYKAFKMLLGVKDQAKLAEWNYAGKNTPETVAAEFLNQFIKQVLARVEEKDVGSLRIGVPEIWGHELIERTVNGKTVTSFSSNVDSKVKLLDICRNLPVLKGSGAEIKTVSEPIAASAYYAGRSRGAEGKPFTGHILLIDYGGGTLDLTLTEVSARDDRGGKAVMEIKAPFKTGAGENYEPGQVGQAGLVYMESLTRRAIADALHTEPTAIGNDQIFQQAVNEVESLLLTQKTEIDGVFTTVGVNKADLDSNSMEAMGNEPYLGEFRYGKEDVLLSYLQLLEVYEEIIAPVLRENLNEYVRYRDEKHIDDSEKNAEHFRFVLVGGFGNFYLVKNQIAEFFRFRADDTRREYIFDSTADGELAVSKGAALIAAGVVELRQTPPCSIGVAVKRGDKYLKSFAMLYNKEDVYGEPFAYDTFYLQRGLFANHERQVISSLGGISDFLYCDKEDIRATLVLTPIGELRAKIREISKSSSLVAYFSVDDQGIFTLKLQAYNVPDEKVEEGTEVTIRLDRLDKMFDTQDLRRAFPDE